MQESPVTVGGPAAGLSKAPLKSENAPENKPSSIVSRATTPSQAITDSAIQAGKTGDEQSVSHDPEVKMAMSSKTGQKYILQVASYKEKDKSDQVSKQMRKLGYNSHVVPANIKGKGRWYRVIIGGYESEGKAKKAVGELAGKMNGLNAIIRPEQ
jgi:cell division protein FtsN